MRKPARQPCQPPRGLQAGTLGTLSREGFDEQGVWRRLHGMTTAILQGREKYAVVKIFTGGTSAPLIQMEDVEASRPTYWGVWGG